MAASLHASIHDYWRSDVSASDPNEYSVLGYLEVAIIFMLFIYLLRW
jgi:hypothetical protein